MRRDQDLSDLADVFRLLGDPSRLRILFCCADAPQTVGVIAAATGLSSSLVSHHLRLLRAARIVAAERRGRFVAYSLADAHVRCTLFDMADHVAEPDADVADHAA